MSKSSQSMESSLHKTSFLDLPFEVRDHIYHLVLVSSSPLIAWAGKTLPYIDRDYAHDGYQWEGLEGTSDGIFEPQGFLMGPYYANALPVEQFIVKISLVSRQVSWEARAVFWSRNTFRFLKGWIWDSVLEWLVSIGDENRGHLRNLELTLNRLQRVWQLDYPLGARTQLDISPHYRHSYMLKENRRERVYPRNRHLALPKVEDDRDLIGPVENISPAVEAVFQLLGRTQSNFGHGTEHSLTMRMLLPRQSFPVTNDSNTEGQSFGSDMSMDLPNVMEKCRQIYITTGTKQVEVLWISSYWIYQSHNKCKVCKVIHWSKSWDIVEEKVEHRRHVYGEEGVIRIWSAWRYKGIDGEVVARMPFGYPEKERE